MKQHFITTVILAALGIALTQARQPAPQLPEGARALRDLTFYTVAGGGHGNFKDLQVPPMVDAFFARQLKKK